MRSTWYIRHRNERRSLFQAGASAAGRGFADAHAEAVFINGHTRTLVAETVQDIRRHAVETGRHANDVKIFLGASIIVAPTDAEARDRHAEYQRWIDDEGALALLSGWSGVDLSCYGLNEPIQHVQGNAMRSLIEASTTRSPDRHLDCA
jgi:alkanesulfonate monooxygenase SsuD/methylene tetrahydromethanopterin reductase-like flavin-dependent oxidoreductase (luciferase family)